MKKGKEEYERKTEILRKERKEKYEDVLATIQQNLHLCNNTEGGDTSSIPSAMKKENKGIEEDLYSFMIAYDLSDVVLATVSPAVAGVVREGATGDPSTLISLPVGHL